MHTRSGMTRIALTAAVVGCVLAAPAAAQAAGAWSFAGPSTILRHCGTDPGTGTPGLEVSTGSFVGVFKPDSTRNIRVGETFALAVDVQNVSSCDDDAAVIPALKLPAGVQIVNVARPVSCLRFDSTPPAVPVQNLSASAMCPQTPPTVNGFLNLGLVNAPAGVGYALANPRNGVEIQVLVRATTAGAKVAEARVCDLMAGACLGSPAANVGVSIEFTVDPAQPGTQPSPAGPSETPGAQPLPGTVIKYALPFQDVSASTPTSIAINGTVIADRPGRIVAELQLGMSAVLSGDPEEVEAIAVPPGTWDVDATFEDYPVPFSDYTARLCFEPESGTRLCGGYQRVKTEHVITDVKQTRASNIRREGVGYAATLTSAVVAPHAKGVLRVEYQSTLAAMLGPIVTNPVQTTDGEFFPAARGDAEQTKEVTLTGLARFVEYQHRACFRTSILNYPAGFQHIEKCSPWRKFTPS